MAIQVTQITGDIVELAFNPSEDDLHVGESLSLRGRHDDRGLIVQVIELQSIFEASPRFGRDRRSPAGLPAVTPARGDQPARPPHRRTASSLAHESHGLHLAVAKIRKTADPAWHPWDGWLPRSLLTVTRITDHELLRRCIPESYTPIWLGKTLAGEPFHIEAATLGTVNLIVGAAGSGTASLAQALMGELLAHGLPCIVFDTRGVHARLSQAWVDSLPSEEGPPAVVHLVVGRNLRLGVSQMGLDGIFRLLRRFDLPTDIAMYFKSHMARHFAQRQAQPDADRSRPALGIDELMRLAQELETAGQAVAGGAILGCLEAIKQTQVFATQPAEGTAFVDGYYRIRDGGLLVIDFSKLHQGARASVASSLLGMLQELWAAESASTAAPPCLIFDQAQAFPARRFIADVLTPRGPQGLRSFFVTTMDTRLVSQLQYDADNLFLCQLGYDAAWPLVKRSRVDAATLHGLGRCLDSRHTLLIGKATGGYPIVFTVEPLNGMVLPSESLALSHTPADLHQPPRTYARRRFSARAGARAEPDVSLPLFPDDPTPRTATLESRQDQRTAAISPSATPTIEQVIALWDRVVRRVARRRRIFEPILAAAHPLRISSQGLVLGFPPQHRFQQELVESEEYRNLLEEELMKALGVSLEVTTEVSPT
jgi:hypothetical protein